MSAPNDASPSGSLESRITRAEPADNEASDATPAAAAAPATTTSTQDKRLSWAEETAEPTGQTPPNEMENDTGLKQAEYDVEVKLSDIQSNTDSPLYSISSFEQLGMYALPTYLFHTSAVLTQPQR